MFLRLFKITLSAVPEPISYNFEIKQVEGFTFLKEQFANNCENLINSFKLSNGDIVIGDTGYKFSKMSTEELYQAALRELKNIQQNTENSQEEL